jgi:anti-sigma B factor antagonist
MDISHEQLDGHILKINLSGRLDVSGSQETDAKLAQLTAAPVGAVIVDLSKVVFLASIGIRTLLLTAKALRTRGGKMVLLNPDASVAKVLEMSGVDMIISVFRDLNAARGALADRQSGGT